MLAQPWNLLGPNPNVAWYNKKRVWLIYFFLIYIGRVLFSLLHFNTAWAWTLTNVFHAILTFLVLHWSKGSPFPHRAGKTDRLTVWEQIDNEAFYSPTKKVFTVVPIVVFFFALHFNQYNPTEFVINALALLLVLVPKLPQLHRVRLFGINSN